MSPGPAASPPLTLSGVLRATLALVRRRALLYTLLAVLLSVLPDLVVDWAVDLDDPVAPDGSFEDLLAGIVDGLEGVGPVLLSVLLDVAVLSVALRWASSARVGACCRSPSRPPRSPWAGPRWISGTPSTSA